MRFPFDEDVLVEAAHTYIKMNRYLSAAEYFERAARFNPKYYAEAVELYRGQGQIIKAKGMLSLIPDTDKRLKQIMALNIEAEHYESIVKVSDEISRSGLLKDQEVNYALAYSYFRLGDFGVVEKYLQKISEPNLLKKAIVLREGISNCKENGVWTCL